MDLASVRKMYTGTGIEVHHNNSSSEKLANMNRRRKEILELLQERGAMNIPEITKLTGYARATVFDDTKALVVSGHLVKIGSGSLTKLKAVTF